MRSSLPSPLTSASAKESGFEPTATGEPKPALNEPPPVPSSTLTLLLDTLAATMSGRPSPLMSAMATDFGRAPTAYGDPGAALNAPVPFPNSTLTLLLE